MESFFHISKRHFISSIIITCSIFFCSFVSSQQNSFTSNQDDNIIIDVTLRRGKPLAEQLSKDNTVYEVRYTFDLKGRSVVIPQGCVLVFNGGKFRNGTIVGNVTRIENKRKKPIVSNVILDGSWNVEIAYPEWFGAAGNGRKDDREAVQAAFNVGNTVMLKNNYLIKNAPFDFRRYRHIPDDELDYYQDVLAQKNQTPDALLTPLHLHSNKKIFISGTLKAYSPLGILIELKGDNTVITGGGTIEGCGIVNTVNVYSGEPDYVVTKWESALIYIKGSNNRVDGITIKNPTRQGISVDDYLSKNNVICNNVIGGGLRLHTQAVETCNFSGLFGIYSRGTNTIVRNNEFKQIDGKSVYDALFCDYTTVNVPPSPAERKEIHTLFENNTVESALEHAVYSYSANLRIIGNTLCSEATALQLFHRNQVVDSNIIYCNERASGINVSGEDQIITNNKLYNVGLYGIRCEGYYNGSCDNDYVAGNYIEKIMAPFSESQPNTTPAITFESSEFRNNKLKLNKIICENNTVICMDEAESARTIPIVGIIAVYGSESSSIGEIHIRDNTVLNSNVANNIAITMLNKTRSAIAYIEGNTCVNTRPILSSIPYDPVLFIEGVKMAYIKGNQLEQQGMLNGVKNAGSAFQLKNVDKAVFSENDMQAQMYSNNQFFVISNVPSFEIDGSNVINGCRVEQMVTIPEKTTGATSLRFTMPNNHSRLEIIPVNDYARKNDRKNPLVIDSKSINGVQIRHNKAADRSTQYRIKVIYY